MENAAFSHLSQEAQAKSPHTFPNQPSSGVRVAEGQKSF